MSLALLICDRNWLFCVSKGINGLAPKLLESLEVQGINDRCFASLISQILRYFVCELHKTPLFVILLGYDHFAFTYK